jgi:hypothetical protein
MSATFPMDEILWMARSAACSRLHELMDRVPPAELTALEVLALVAILESADERVNAHPAPVLELICQGVAISATPEPGDDALDRLE